MLRLLLLCLCLTTSACKRNKVEPNAREMAGGYADEEALFSSLDDRHIAMYHVLDSERQQVMLEDAREDAEIRLERLYEEMKDERRTP